MGGLDPPPKPTACSLLIRLMQLNDYNELIRGLRVAL